MNYKNFKLDRFQEEAIKAIEQNHSVIVAAPTGAGKTLIAEYVLEKYLNSGQKVIYTAPIKALSNQKFRDFSREYGDKIGIITGDVVINDEAPALIMTTEILRNIIFDDIHRLDDVRYIIFDEIHYIDDIERGTVWEECIIFAPQQIHFLCLSATIPNLREFANWMQSVRHSKIDVVFETERPVPLEHKLYLRGYGLCWLNEFKDIKKAIANNWDVARNRAFAKGIEIGDREPETEVQVIIEPIERREGIIELDGVDIIEHIQNHDQLPCLYFSFSRKSCEDLAMQNIDRNLLSLEEQEIILYEYDRLCEKFNVKNDRSAKELRELIVHGVAYHHAGMLPTLKEVVERLFTMGYIKLLFATETFALGVNMPACSVVFGSLAKYDGVQFRYLKAREYHQMAGRAGRRGIDERGFVYACVDAEYDEFDEIKRIVSGEVEKIESQFNLSYSSILNLYDKYHNDIYDICDKSLGNYQNVKTLRDLSRSLERTIASKENIGVVSCIYGDANNIYRYIELEEKLIKEQEEIQSTMDWSLSRKKKRKRINKLTRKTSKIINIMKGLKCVKCRNLKRCRQLARKIIEIDNRIDEISKQLEFVKNYQKSQIKNRLDLLKKIGYIDDEGLLPRGRIASKIYGYEIQTTEALFAGHFHRLDPEWINVLVTAIVFESKRDCWYNTMDKKLIRSVLREPIQRIEEIIKMEIELGIPPMKSLDTKLSSAVYEWSRGCSFEELSKYTDAPPGDLVRYFRLASDLLRQIKRVLVKDDALLTKINDCISRINRDVVDAERQLRAD